MFDTLLVRCKVTPWISSPKKLFFIFFPSIFTCLRFLNRANPCCKHLPSKLGDHFVNTSFHEYSPILFIRWTTSYVFFFQYCPKKKKKKLWRIPKIATFMWGWSAFLLAPLYRWEEENFGQRIWEKVSCYWEHPSRTHWKLEKYHERTWWEHKNKRIPSSHSPSPKEKKDEPCWVYV